MKTAIAMAGCIWGLVPGCVLETKSAGEAEEIETAATDPTGATGESGDVLTSAASDPESGTVPAVAPCEGDEPIGHGAYECESGAEHRKEPASCEPAPPRHPCTDPGDGTGFYESDCATDADCGDQRCEQWQNLDFGPVCMCEPAPCQTQADCSEGTTCHCDDLDPVGQCQPSNCTTDADCPGFLCAVSEDACGTAGLFCTTPDDECDASSGCVYNSDVNRWKGNGAGGCP